MKKNYTERIFPLILALMSVVGVLFFVWRGYKSALEAWEYILHFRPDAFGYPIGGQLLNIWWELLGLVAMVFFCAVCLDSTVTSLREYVERLRMDDCSMEPEAGEEVVIKKV